jgi:hypothetical protein
MSVVVPDKDVVKELAAEISDWIQNCAPQGVFARSLAKYMTQRSRAWVHFAKETHYHTPKERKALVKRAITKLKNDGKIVSEPTRSVRLRWNRKTGKMEYPIINWVYKWVDNPLDALAHLNPLSGT